MVTALPLQPGMVNLTSGRHSSIRIIHCEEDGEIKLWLNASDSESYSMTAKADRFVDGFVAVEVIAGTFTLAR